MNERPSVIEIFATIDEVRARLYGRVAGLSAEQSGFRLEAQAWSVADTVEHLSIVEMQVLRLVKRLLRQVEAEGVSTSRAQVAGLATLRERHERSLKERYKAPPAVEPRGGMSLADALARLRHTRQALHDLRPRLEALDLSNVTYPHPIFGPLNLYQWLDFIGLHEDRHLRQINALLTHLETIG